MENNTEQNKQDKKRCKQLLECIKNYDVDQVRTLLESKLDLNTMVNRQLPLVRAAARGKTDLVELLLNAGADPDKCETVFDNYGGLYINRCALLECPFIGDKGVDIAQMLLDRGADMHILDDEGNSVFENAVAHGHIKLIDVLLEHGASVNEKGASGDMPLHHACMDDNVKVAGYLIEKGADVNPKDSHSPLQIASYRGHLDMVEFLLSKGANPNHKDPKGQTAFLIACYQGNLPVVKVLLEGGADINTCSNSGDTCIHFSCYQYPNKNVLKYLVDKGADLYGKNNDGHTAFSQICPTLARTDAVVALLGAGFDVQKDTSVTEPGVFLQKISMLTSIRKRTHQKRVNQMAELLVAIGYDIPDVSSIQSIRNMLNRLGFSAKSADLCDWLMEQKTNAKPLKNLCRLNIRNLIGLSLDIDEKIESLPLPEKIKEFMRYEELTNQEGKERCLGCNEYMNECECQAEDSNYHEDYRVDWDDDSDDNVAPVEDD